MLGQIYSLTLASDSLSRMSFNLRSSLTASAFCCCAASEFSLLFPPEPDQLRIPLQKKSRKPPCLDRHPTSVIFLNLY